MNRPATSAAMVQEDFLECTVLQVHNHDGKRPGWEPNPWPEATRKAFLSTSEPNRTVCSLRL